MIYTRNFSNKKFSPPPGYVGTAFSDVDSLKHHEPSDDISVKPSAKETLEYEDRNIIEFDDDVQGSDLKKEYRTVSERDTNSLNALLPELLGKIGTEELIILLVMLLVSADGIGPEVLILALVLLA